MPTEAIFGALAFVALFVLFVVLPSKLQQHSEAETSTPETVSGAD